MNEIQMFGPETKLRTYKLFKLTSGMEPYLISNPRLSYIHAIARFRISSHTLEIETGRHRRPKVPIEERTCKICRSNSVEDEQHFLIECLVADMVQLRNQLTATAITYISNYNTLNNQDKFNEILTNREPDIITAISRYLTMTKTHVLGNIPSLNDVSGVRREWSSLNLVLREILLKMSCLSMNPRISESCFVTTDSMNIPGNSY